MEPVSGNSSSPTNFLTTPAITPSAQLPDEQTQTRKHGFLYVPASLLAVDQEAAVAVGFTRPASNNSSSTRVGLFLTQIALSWQSFILIVKSPAVDTQSAGKGTEVIGIHSLGELAREDAAQHDDYRGVSTQH